MEPQEDDELITLPQIRPTIDVPVETRGDDIFLQQGDRNYRVRGLSKNMSYELLKVNVLVSGTTNRGESAWVIESKTERLLCCGT